MLLQWLIKLFCNHIGNFQLVGKLTAEVSMLLTHVGYLTFWLQQIIERTAYRLTEAGSGILLTLRRIGTAVPGNVLHNKAIFDSQPQHCAQHQQQSQEQQRLVANSSTDTGPRQIHTEGIKCDRHTQRQQSGANDRQRIKTASNN